jgi:hypothetical protein
MNRSWHSGLCACCSPSAGEPAPYGKGMATVYDENVRRATQLAPELVAPSKAWTDTLRDITQAAAKELGADPVSAASSQSHDTCLW